MTSPDDPCGDTDGALPSCTTEEHPAGYNHASRFRNARVIGGGEGGSILIADDTSGAYVITDESMLAEFLDVEEARAISFVVIHRFDSAADRDRYCKIRFGPLIRATEQLRNFL